VMVVVAVVYRLYSIVIVCLIRENVT
jgi:hypothetical protein